MRKGGIWDGNYLGGKRDPNESDRYRVWLSLTYVKSVQFGIAFTQTNALIAYIFLEKL